MRSDRPVVQQFCTREACIIITLLFYGIFITYRISFLGGFSQIDDLTLD